MLLCPSLCGRCSSRLQVDASHSMWRKQKAAVDGTLEDMGVAQKPRIVMYNKIDALQVGPPARQPVSQSHTSHSSRFQSRLPSRVQSIRGITSCPKRKRSATLALHNECAHKLTPRCHFPPPLSGPGERDARGG